MKRDLESLRILPDEPWPSAPQIFVTICLGLVAGAFLGALIAAAFLTHGYAA